MLLCEHVDWRELHPESGSGGLLSDQNHAHTQSAGSHTGGGFSSVRVSLQVFVDLWGV